MKSFAFHIVDVFAEAALAGNQLAVFTDAGSLTTRDMQRFARETNYSETTFIMSRSPRDGGFDVRIFTPKEEVPFAGHPALGTAFIVRQEFVRRRVDRVVLNFRCGPIAVDLEYRDGQVDRLWMHQPRPTFGRELDREIVAATLCISPSEIDDAFPVQEASTGLPFVIIPLKTLEAVRRATVQRERYLELIENIQAKALLIFTRATYSPNNQLNVRVFADYYGTPEDPATGSANGALAGYLAHYRYLGSESVDVRVEQGYEIARPSLLYLRATDRTGEIAVSVGGRVQAVATGSFQCELEYAQAPGRRTSGEHRRTEALYTSLALRPFGTTVFTEMTVLADHWGAINLAQGFPDFEGPPRIIDAAVEALRTGHNQYSPSAGDPILREAIAAHHAQHYDLYVDPAREITIFCGATEGLASSILGLMNPGDEVILFEPFYDSYPACVALAGGVPRFVTLRAPDFTFDPDELRAAFNECTRLVVLNTPHNPTGRVFRRDELEVIARLCQEHDVCVLADEVYEHITYESARHIPIATLPGMWERTLTLSSTGKTFSMTGWKIGWGVGPAPLVAAAQAAHQYVTFCTAAPLQVAMGYTLRECTVDYMAELKREYTQRRNILMEALRDCGFRVIPPQGAYFVVADFSPIREGDDRSFACYLVEHVKVAAVPMSVFYREGSTEGRYLLRFAFCKRSETLRVAADRLKTLRSQGGPEVA